MNKEDFEEYETVKYWMSSLPGRDDTISTKYQWKRLMREFCEWLGKNPDDLIRERKTDLANTDDRVRHRVELKVKEYLRFLESKGLAPNSRKNAFSAIRSFYARNYAELKFFRRDGPRGDIIREQGARAASKEDIEKMVELANPRDRAIVLFLKDTGLSESDVAKLTLENLGIKDTTEIFNAEAPLTIMTKRLKTGIPTITFLGTEGLNALKATLRIRLQGSPELKIRRYGRLEVKGGIPPENLALESPIFRSYGKFLRTLKKPKIEHLTAHAISVIVRKAAIQAGIWVEGFSAHALRRFFQTSLESSGINRNWIMSMMGHRLPGVENSYSKPEIEMLKEAYKKAYPHLATTEVAEQKSRVETLEAQTEKLILNGKTKETLIEELQKQNKALLDEWVTMRDRIEELGKRISLYEKRKAQA